MAEHISARDYRDVALARLDVRAFFEQRLAAPLGPRVGGQEYRFRCPFHEDDQASANVNLKSGLWNCHACDAGGSPIDFVMRSRGIDYKSALAEIGTFAGLEPPTTAKPRTNGTDANSASASAQLAPVRNRGISPEKVAGWHVTALRNSELMAWFRDARGYTEETIERYQLGWDGERVTIPIFDAAGDLYNVRRYLRNSTSQTGKMLWAKTGAKTVLYPMWLGELGEEVIVVEGEWDAILMRQQGFVDTITSTSGAGGWVPEFRAQLDGRRVFICYDNDDAGVRGAARVARDLAAGGIDVRILSIPNLPPKGDVTDFFVEQQRTVEEFRMLMAEAPAYVLGKSALVEEGEPRPTPLHEASSAAFQGQRLALPVLLSGKAMTPYMIPYRYRLSCDRTNKRLCSVCPFHAEVESGEVDVTLSAAKPEVLSLIAVTKETQTKALRAIGGAIAECPRANIEVQESINVEEIRLIPELDNRAAGGGDTEYVSRVGYALMHGLLPNRGYTMIGYAHPLPKSQAVVHLLSEAIPAQDNISAFAMTPELDNDLKIFRAEGDVDARWRDIYADLAHNVHRIQDRFDMQVAYDLMWHSVIGFTFNGAPVRRGWVEMMLMGDSGQGKTEMGMELLRHYRLGERVQGEQSSTAGLIGGLEKMGDTWLLSWGRIPLNDKRALIIDEAQGLAATQVEGMSDVRATGVAEITKIRTERTNARCRIAWLANPIDGMTLAQHNQGVLSIARMFKKPEDIRRLDFAVCVASGDVDFERAINVRHDAAIAPRYSSDLCRSLVLWAWSRRDDQVEFTPEATTDILASATDMGRRYHASIPLVEPADQRLKLARLAAAAAARVYSTDDGEKLVVRPEHVRFVVEYLERVYQAPSMSYGEYSESMRRTEELEPDAEMAVLGEIRAWTNAAAAISFLRSANRFKKSDLIDAIGWDDGYAKGQLQMLTRHRLIRSVRDGYLKLPAFIDLLRTVAANGVPASNFDDLLTRQNGAPF